MVVVNSQAKNDEVVTQLINAGVQQAAIDLRRDPSVFQTSAGDQPAYTNWNTSPFPEGMGVMAATILEFAEKGISVVQEVEPRDS